MMHYYYLLYSFIFLCALGVALWQRPDLRASAWRVAILGAILNPLGELLYFRDYWRPDSLFGHGVVSIEDVIFGASVAALAVVAYPYFLGKCWKHDDQKRQVQPIAGSALLTLTVLLVLILNLGLHINSVFAVALAVLPGWLYMLARKPAVRVPSLLAGVIFVAIATAGYILGLDFIAPQTLDAWWFLQHTRWGVTILGNVPVSELCWFWAVSTFTSALYMFTTGRRFDSDRKALSAE